jgi:U5 snRNP spliceosome subunit
MHCSMQTLLLFFLSPFNLSSILPLFFPSFFTFHLVSLSPQGILLTSFPSSRFSSSPSSSSSPPPPPPPLSSTSSCFSSFSSSSSPPSPPSPSHQLLFSICSVRTHLIFYAAFYEIRKLAKPPSAEVVRVLQGDAKCSAGLNN